MQVSCKKGSITSAARTQGCNPPLMLLLLWDVAAFRGRGLEVDGVIDTESMRISCPHETARPAFSDFSTQRPGFKKVRSQDPRGWSAKCKTCAFPQKSVSMWMAPISQNSYSQWKRGEGAARLSLWEQFTVNFENNVTRHFSSWPKTDWFEKFQEKSLELLPFNHLKQIIL